MAMKATDGWVTVGTITLKSGWHFFEAPDMWVNCGSFKLQMEGPDFGRQIIPAAYYQRQWGNIRSGVVPGDAEPFALSTSTPTPTSLATPAPTSSPTPAATQVPLPVDEDVHLENIRAGSMVDMLADEVIGVLSSTGNLTVQLEPYAGKSYLIQPTG